MPAEQPDFAPVKTRRKPTRKENLDAYRASLEEYRNEKRAFQQRERQRANIALFLLSNDAAKGMPLLFNLATGQVAAREDILGYNAEQHAGRSISFPQRFPQMFRRVRAADGLRLLNTHDSTFRTLPLDFEPQTELPTWFFQKSNEPRPDLVRAMRRVRLRRLGSNVNTGISDFFKSIFEFLMGALGLVLLALSLAVMAYIAWYFFSGIAGLLEFGRKQL